MDNEILYPVYLRFSTVVCSIHYIISYNTLEWEMWAYNTNSNGNPV